MSCPLRLCWHCRPVSRAGWLVHRSKCGLRCRGLWLRARGLCLFLCRAGRLRRWPLVADIMCQSAAADFHAGIDHLHCDIAKAVALLQCAEDRGAVHFDNIARSQRCLRLRCQRVKHWGNRLRNRHGDRGLQLWASLRKHDFLLFCMSSLWNRIPLRKNYACLLGYPQVCPAPIRKIVATRLGPWLTRDHLFRTWLILLPKDGFAREQWGLCPAQNGPCFCRV